MGAVRVFNNHAGTTSDSFLIGKGGIELLQGTSNPVGISAPVGSLYVLKGASSNGVYQIDESGNWSPLLFPTSIANGAGTTATASNGVVTVNNNPIKYKNAFTAENLSSGVLTVTHELNEQYPLVVVYNDSGQVVNPDQITSVDANNTSIDLSSYVVANTWNVTILSGY